MNTRSYISMSLTGLLLSLLFVDAVPAQQPPPQPQPPTQPQANVLEPEARGPVHEAFAQPMDTRPEPSPVITKQPPAPIDEVPPDQKPEGDNVQWIPGYWQWDDDTSNFIWVSGCWRDVPPGRSWVPGHWQEVDGGWVWVAGFWANDNLTEVQYLPAPPPSLDQGPSSPAPDENSIYNPGCWVYQTNRYFWRPGFWVPYQQDWVWTPACYTWTPSGFLFADGYWDYPLDQRGLLFSPVRFGPGFFAAQRPYIPGYVVNPDFLLGALFVRSATRHYYFGDYFEPRYDRMGFVPWTDYHPVKGAYDPNFAYYRHLHTKDASWEPAMRNLYTARRSGEIPRPPRTWNQQNEAIRKIHTNKSDNINVYKNVNITHIQNNSALTQLNEVHNTKITHLNSIGGGKQAGSPPRELKMEQVTKEAREREQKAAAVMYQGAQQRREMEARMLGEGKIPQQHTDPAHMMKMTVPKLPATVNTPRPNPPVRRAAPPAVVAPKHEERPIPKYEPPHPFAPPKAAAPPKKGKPDKP